MSARPRSLREGGPRARVAFVNSHPIQYFAPLYRHLNRSADIEAVPVYLSDYSLRGTIDKGFGQKVTWDIDLLGGTDPVFIKGFERRAPEDAMRLVAPGVWGEIRRGGYDALVVHGHVYTANHLALAAAKSIGIPAFTRGESHLGLRRPGWKRHLRERVIGHLYRLFDGFLAIGSANRAFYRANGVPQAKLSHFPYSVDNARLSENAAMSAEERAEYRAALDLPAEAPVVLFASKFEPRKHADDLIRACAALAREGLDLALVVAGAGEMDAELKALAAGHPELAVRFPGFINQAALPRLFGACDVFALPSEEEPWGLIINEAMAAGLPVVASSEIGSVEDLVRDGENGHVFEARDVSGLTDALRPIVADAALRARMADASRRIIAAWSYAECEAGLRDALTKAGVFAKTRR